MITIDLKNKIILMTGALGGIAKYMVKGLIDAVSTLILTDKRGVEDARPTLQARGWPEENYYSMDVTTIKEVQKTINQVFKKWPAVNIALGHAFVYLCSPLANELDGHALQVDNGLGLPKLG